MTARQPVSISRRRLLAVAATGACGWVLLPVAKALAAAVPSMRRRPLELPLAAADLYAPHDLAG